jgi:hypothetical protein
MRINIKRAEISAEKVWKLLKKSLSLQTENNKNKVSAMETTRRFATRTEQADYYAKLRGWKPLTKEEEKILDDAVRMVTHLD